MTTMKSLIYFSKFTVLSENKNSTLPSSSLRSLVLHFAGCKVENKKACEGQKWLEPVWPVTNLINILWAQIMILESWYVQISSQYDSRVINYNYKVLYKIDQRLGNFGDFLPTNFVDFLGYFGNITFKLLCPLVWATFGKFGYLLFQHVVTLAGTDFINKF